MTPTPDDEPMFTGSTITDLLATVERVEKLTEQSIAAMSAEEREKMRCL